MRLHYKGKYSGDENTLPQKEVEGAKQFKEPEMKKLLLLANLFSIVVFVVLLIPIAIHVWDIFLKEYLTLYYQFFLACLLSLLMMFPHEILHALCFKEDVELYTYFSKGALFVTGTEDMSKLRFIVMSLCPNIVFGLIPYIIWCFFPDLVGVGLFGALSTAMGCGDYMNIFNALTQVPKGACVYMSGTHSFWYMKED